MWLPPNFSGANSFMCLLCPLHAFDKVAGVGRNKLTAILTTDEFPGFDYSGAGNTGRVGTHIGDETYVSLFAYGQTLIKLLGDSHSMAGTKVELTPCFLLEGAGYKRRCWLAGYLFSTYFKNGVVGLLKFITNLFGFFLIVNIQLGAINKTNQRSSERCLLRRCYFLGQLSLDSPVLYRDKFLNFPLAVNDNPYCHRLNSACGETLPYLSPEQGANLIAYQSIQDTPCLLGVDQLHIY